MTWPGVIGRFRDRLSVTAETPVVTLLEGNTPLLEAQVLSQHVGRPVYLKYDGANPTGSFKDRGMTMAVSKALEALSLIHISEPTRLRLKSRIPAYA